MPDKNERQITELKKQIEKLKNSCASSEFQIQHGDGHLEFELGREAANSFYGAILEKNRTELQQLEQILSDIQGDCTDTTQSTN